jgi:hypothetical protein
MYKIPLSKLLIPNVPAQFHHIITCMSVTIDGVWNGDRNHWTLTYSALLHFTFHYYTYEVYWKVPGLAQKEMLA